MFWCLLFQVFLRVTLWLFGLLGFAVCAFLSEVGGCSTGKPFRSVRACVRAVWLPSGAGSQKRLLVFSLSLLVPPSFPFSLLGRRAFLFPFPPTPKPPIQL